MVAHDYPTSSLTTEAAMAFLDQGMPISAVEHDQHLFSFRLRPAARRTPATVMVLVDCAYLDVGWLRPRAMRLEELPRKFKQAPLECFERLQVYALFDRFLLRGASLEGVVLWLAKVFEDQRERAYQRAHPDLHRQMVADKNVTCLNRIRNCGSISEAQEAQVRRRLERAKPVGRTLKPRPSERDIAVANDYLRDPNECNESELAWARDILANIRNPDP